MPLPEHKSLIWAAGSWPAALLFFFACLDHGVLGLRAGRGSRSAVTLSRSATSEDLVCEPLPELRAPARVERWATPGQGCARRLPEAASCEPPSGPNQTQHLLRDFWKNESCPLSEASLRNASRPQGFLGARLRLRRAMRRLLDGQGLHVAVLGTSMTHGTGTNRAWPSRLQELFEGLGLNVTVTNLARGGTTTQWAFANLHALLKTLSRADVVLVDYELNDREGNRGFAMSGGVVGIQKIYGDLLQLLLSLPNHPAVVDILTFSETESVLMNRGPWMHTNRCEEIDVTSYHHWPVDQKFQVPVLSYAAAVCSVGRTFWIKDGETADSRASPHPGGITHDLLARVVRGFLLDEMDMACSGDLSDAVDHPEMVDQARVHASCLAQPLTSLSALDGESSFPSLVRSDGWWFGEDVAGKPGWLARFPGDIAFTVSTRSGWVQVEYLGTYKDIGCVAMWLDDGSPGPGNACILNGLWSDTTSRSKFSLVMSNLPAGNHTLGSVPSAESSSSQASRPAERPRAAATREP
eukprot:CAMPEP_0168398138 /NCGR_PEP_ID=MMETSP0228-20121227/21424_1 /TAXON_ID=133427 /ORGANISM="Protoceratium reticulatum, Strain CCCM 535 (=CCMP 1889)" /LENGTH=523 /DNA_ID=CAMNT_0008411631 /DNA_START=13 /DNA_END=1582 /DNA_ORIENTATION=+